MRRAIAVALSIGLLAGAFAMPADAAEKKKKKKPKKVQRVVEHSYHAPSPGVAGAPYSACLAQIDPEAGCVNIPIGAGEKFVQVKIEDASGQTPYWILAQDTNPDTVGYDIFHTGCGDSEEPIPIAEGLELRISVYASGGAQCPGVSTTGNIKATLSNLP